MHQKNYCFINGDIRPYEDCQIHISDLLFQRGYGVFDFFRSRKGEIPWLDDYTERFFNSMQLADIDLKLSRQEFISIVHELKNKNGNRNEGFKAIATGGLSGTLESVTGPPNFLLLNLPWKRPDEQTFNEGVNLIKCEYIRPNPEIKTLNYFNMLRLHKKLKEFAAVDVLYHNNLLTEASRANIFLVKEDSILTPLSNILKGVTRKQLLKLSGDIRVEDVETSRIFDFDEVFISSTTRDITPVVSIEGKKVGNGRPGPVTRELLSAFRSKGW